MSYCPKCGNKVDESAAFCPRCGAPLKVEASAKPTTPSAYRRDEKSEKSEKHEKRESGPLIWVMIGALIIVVGLLSYLSASGFLSSALQAPLVLLVVGVALTIFGFYLYVARRRHLPSTFA